DKSRPGLTESAPTLEGTPAHELTAATYPHLKAESERVVLGVMGARALTVRASLEVGPYETADRLPYWIRRIREAETVLAPGRPGGAGAAAGGPRPGGGGAEGGWGGAQRRLYRRQRGRMADQGPLSK